MTKAELLNYIDSQTNKGNMGVLMIRKYVEDRLIQCKNCIWFDEGEDEWGKCFQNRDPQWTNEDFCSYGETEEYRIKPESLEGEEE